MAKPRTAPLVALSLACSIQTARVQAQDCDCDHTVALDVQTVDGQGLGIAAGDRVCVMAGEREFLRFGNLRGSAEAPVEVINCGGLVRIHNDDRAYALVFEDDSRFFHLTGTGDSSLDYGFEISAPAEDPYPGVGLWLLGRSSDYEVDHLEIHDTGFAGVSAKTDPLCDGSADRDNFVQANSRFHHLYVHDTGGEGFYIGSTQANGQMITCDGSPELHQPHFLEGIELTDSLIERTGWDGAQVGMARADCLVARNVIRDVGLAGEEFQQQGLQIGSFSKCEIAGNVLQGGPTNGIFVLEADETLVHDNVVADFAGDAIYANLRDRFDGVSYRFYFNTLVDSGGSALRIFGGELGPSEAKSNLVVGGGGGIEAGGDVDWTAEGNLEVGSAIEAGFVAADDYHLTEDSPARGAGVEVDGLTSDLDGHPRPAPPSAGAFEYHEPDWDGGVGLEADAGGGSRNDAGSPGPGDGGPASAGDGGGCGCRTASPGSTLAAWVWLGWLLVRRKSTPC